ncbi:flagellar biosynthesis protein FlhF [Nitrospina watsonii]|uniref:Flagellar biosynthesis protein FlhF n=1 Tax=Nitrospina watsonii TaxID=1323948 RepID=A0ABM9HD12_9BACT|nr:flagellar biosynthesis protein FlhF [Nitrospina watsonii]CAI2717983.1 Flagellar biosynthesis protein FlhF [Nitrospina watsonii]
MRIKKILANNYSEALTRVKEELGEEALVLKTRSIKFGQEGGGQSASMVEITAAMEDASHDAAVATVVEEVPGVSARHPGGRQRFLEEAGNDRELRSLIYTLLSQTDRARSMGLQGDQLDAYQDLVERGIDEHLAARIFESLNMGSDEPTSNVKPITAHVGDAFHFSGPIQLDAIGPKIVALLGPTGSGKTTTTAKLAARFALIEKKKVVLISLDTFRLGAMEQLQIYGDLMRVPVEMATDRNEFLQSLNRHRDADLILIDTMGRNPRDEQYAQELKAIFDAAPNLETHLVQSATAQESVFEQSLKQFRPLGVDCIVLTKTDEGLQFGHLYNIAARHHIPFSYCTNGQRVPEDIEVAGRDGVIRLIFG